jgi:hypothetical protein
MPLAKGIGPRPGEGERTAADRDKCASRWSESIGCTVGKSVARHEAVDQSSDEYVRYVSDPETGEEYAIHTNMLEGYFSLFKRGMKGVYKHWGEKHLHRYLAEF